VIWSHPQDSDRTIRRRKGSGSMGKRRRRGPSGTGVQRQGSSGDRWALRRRQWCWGDHGQVEGVVIDLESFLQQRRCAARVRWPDSGVLDTEESGKHREIWVAAILARRSGWWGGSDCKAGRAGVLWFADNSSSEILLWAVRSSRSRIRRSGAQARSKPCQ
jgi:hypothetical protein